jgi:hypothetical protein
MHQDCACFFEEFLEEKIMPNYIIIFSYTFMLAIASESIIPSDPFMRQYDLPWAACVLPPINRKPSAWKATFRTGTKRQGQAQRHFRADTGAAIQQRRESLTGNAQAPCRLRHGHILRKILAEYLTRVRALCRGHIKKSLMLI